MFNHEGAGEKVRKKIKEKDKKEKRKRKRKYDTVHQYAASLLLGG
jgi:hypothetical protein